MAARLETPGTTPPEAELTGTHLVVDVRTPAEFAAAHIRGSVNVPLGDLSNDGGRLAQLAGERPVALVCRTGKRAEAACAPLAGHAGELRVLEGGVEAWERAGLPLVRGEGGMSLERQVRIVAGSLVVVGVALGFGVHPAFFGLSAFVGAGLVFAGVTDTCGMALVLARMPWNRAGRAGT